ncbi:hypothetical protein [Ferrimonas sp. YFM]|uniref:hypothetical protein n=1 Tax=Ferrimonas sp. YFM TaxID=3028878 RepID=UPI00257415CF|nr:hypothetical protein [Ferrimonas sp. YFM]BDY05394.1 hypothetical protein F0521_24350 [Ferrimonas sp. YFM]
MKDQMNQELKDWQAGIEAALVELMASRFDSPNLSHEQRRDFARRNITKIFKTNTAEYLEAQAEKERQAELKRLWKTFCDELQQRINGEAIKLLNHSDRQWQKWLKEAWEQITGDDLKEVAACPKYPQPQMPRIMVFKELAQREELLARMEAPDLSEIERLEEQMADAIKRVSMDSDKRIAKTQQETLNRHREQAVEQLKADKQQRIREQRESYQSRISNLRSEAMRYEAIKAEHESLKQYLQTLLKDS